MWMILCYQNRSFETGSARSRPPGAGAGLKKNRRKKTRLRLVDFYFFLTKTTPFIFKKKELTQATRWPGQNPGYES